MQKKTATPKSSRKRHSTNNNSLAAQRQCVIDALREVSHGLTTIELREQYDIMAPAARIFELRHNEGKNIQTVWTNDINAQGHSHRVARYVLLPGTWEKTA